MIGRDVAGYVSTVDNLVRIYASFPARMTSTYNQ
jgi:hypothetical protein